tara:strand:- start:388 stop:552 length:165 start_codon:yes stop_codon:yes gene_type:complete
MSALGLGGWDLPPLKPRPAKQLDIFDNGDASQVGERQTDLEDLIAEKKQEQQQC